MGKNAYFQLTNEDSKLCLRVEAAQGGDMFSVEELVKYLEKRHINDYDLVGLNRYLKDGAFAKSFLLSDSEGLPESEGMSIEVDHKGMQAVVRFYPPATNGKLMTKEDIINGLKENNVVYGIDENAIDVFLYNREYCTNVILARAMSPIQGKDAEIVYHFDTNVTARPKLNDDGSVDFHKLGNIKPIKEGELLATLIPADPGKEGLNVYGKSLLPKKVKVRHLRYGRNIEINNNHTELRSQISGHVTLVDDLVMVSNVYNVAKNVDTATGDIEHPGTVEIPGNVLTGYKVKAEGDIIVNGAVEGAILEAGGNIVLKQGMQGMSKGKLKAKGNIMAKYFENCDIEAGGNIMCDALMHCTAKCQGDILVSGKKGMVAGGHICTYGNITVRNAGSTMGTITKLEILPNIEFAKQAKATEEKMLEKKDELRKLEEILSKLKMIISSGQKLTKEQENYLKLAALNYRKEMTNYEALTAEYESLDDKVEASSNVRIRVEGTIYNGVRIVIKDAMKIIRESMNRAQFTREGADIKMSSF